MNAVEDYTTDLQNALKALRNAHLALERIGKTEPSLLGLAGEILVMLKLHDLDIGFQPKGGQAPFDILLTETKPYKKIEVRTSPLKQWLNKKINTTLSGHVWSLMRKNQPPKYDLIVCVAINTIDQGFDDVNFYLFTNDEVISAEEINHQRFSVSKLLHLPSSQEDFRNMSKLTTEDYTEWEREVYPRIDDYRLESRIPQLRN
ncbi:MAG: hypothetical protein ACFFCP_16530 [Promethearchaeota archaeon]